MSIINRLNYWLETHACTPAYAGLLLAGIAFSFFAAATNTMAGWLYVISGLIIALLGLAAVLPPRTLKQIQVRRQPISPVSVGEQLTIILEIKNQSLKPKTFLQIQDILQSELGKIVETPVEVINPQSTYEWVYYQPTKKRGVYRWQEVHLRTATPLGLFWCRRSWKAPAVAIVYPTVLPLTSCPLIDKIGQDDSAKTFSARRSNAAVEDITRTLRPYRIGDPTRLIHWRTSARHGDLRVRELEVFTGSQDIVICLDSANSWNFDDFEQAVTAAASIYFYAMKIQLSVKLWTARTGLIQGNQVVLEALAATQAGEDAEGGKLPNLPLIWLTQNSISLNTLPLGSRWLMWQKAASEKAMNNSDSGIIIDTTEPLQTQLQRPLR
ncbi:MAG: DUF58 domain-containing protein [Coleofasciculaceae cyanobacterium]